MKLLLSLILILSIVFNSANCIKTQNQNQLFGDSSSSGSSSGPKQNCFTNGNIELEGYTSVFAIVANNGNYVFDNTIKQQTFSEQGNINVDFKNQQLYVNYNVQVGGSNTMGKLWGFSSNNTQYVIPDVSSGPLICYSSELTFDFPTLLNVVYQSDVKIGTYQCEAFTIEKDNSSPSNSTYQILFVGKDDCSLTSTISYNTDGNNQGTVLTNLYEFVAESNPSDFYLPSICSNPTPIAPSNIKLFSKIHKLPTVILSVI